MADTSIRTTIRNYVVENFLFGTDDGFGDEQSFLEKGIIDSTGVLDLVGYIERTFNVKVADDELTPENLDSVRQIERFVENKSTK